MTATVYQLPNTTIATTAIDASKLFFMIILQPSSVVPAQPAGFRDLRPNLLDSLSGRVLNRLIAVVQRALQRRQRVLRCGAEQAERNG